MTGAHGAGSDVPAVPEAPDGLRSELGTGVAPVPSAPAAVGPFPVVQVPFSRLYRAHPRYAAWRPAFAIALAAVFILVGTVVVLGAGVAVGWALGLIDPGDPGDISAYFGTIDAGKPLSIAVGLAGVAIWLPGIRLAVLLAGIRPTGAISSVALRLRWRWLAACIVPAIVVMAGSTLLELYVLPFLFGQKIIAPSGDPAIVALSLLVIVLLVPLQSTAEEYAFRGLVQQSVGSWIRWPWVGMVVSTAVFAALHSYDAWGLASVAVFALTSAILSWRTGGLEAGIVLHVSNNLVAFGTLAGGLLGTTKVTSDGGGPIDVIESIIVMGLYAWWVLARARKRSLVRTAPVPVQPGTTAALIAGRTGRARV